MTKLKDPTGAGAVPTRSSYQPKHVEKMGNLPDYSAPDYSAIEEDRLSGWSQNPEHEMQYLKRLHLRSKLAQDPDRSKYVPLPSMYEAAVGEELKKMNEYATDPKLRLEWEFLQTRLGSSSPFNCALKLADMKLKRQSTNELITLVDKGPEALIKDAINGGEVNAISEARARLHSARRRYRTEIREGVPPPGLG